METVQIVIIVIAVVVLIGLLLWFHHEDQKTDRVYRDAYRKLDRITKQEHSILESMANENPRKGTGGHGRSDTPDS